jgi:thiol-disulfide isomerase/thioredoxin
MIIKTLRILSLGLLGLLLVSCTSGESKKTEAQSQPKTDKQYVEQAVFTNFDGEKVPISKFEGKVVLIDFWETWCKPCIASFPTLQKLQETYNDDFAVLAVTPGFTDTKEDAEEFAQDHDYSFNYLMDSNGLHKKLGVQGIPFKVFVDANGEFIKKSMGSYGPEEDYKKIKKIIEEHKKSKMQDVE